MSFENKTNEKGERYVWLEPRVVDRLRLPHAVRGELQRRDYAASDDLTGARALSRRFASSVQLKYIPPG